jgi:hypothetical protein
LIHGQIFAEWNHSAARRWQTNAANVAFINMHDVSPDQQALHFCSILRAQEFALFAKNASFQRVKALLLHFFEHSPVLWHRRCNYVQFINGNHDSKTNNVQTTYSNRPSRNATMDTQINTAGKSNDTEQLPIDLNDLISAVQGLPEEHRKTLQQPLDRVIEYTKRRRRILNLIQDALSQLRMDMKYLMFDLEATRRERDAYKDGFESDF